MSVRYIIGGTGAGKSHYIYEKILEEAELHKTKSFYFIVPEQSNMQVQRELVKMSKRACIMNVDVLSFMRLAHRVFDEVGRKERLILEDIGKSMVVRKLLNTLSDDFLYFKKAATKAGFTEEMKSILTELMQYNVGVENLEEMEKMEGLSSVIKAKLHDTRLILEGFQSYKEEKYIVAEKILDELSEVLLETEYLNDAVFVFDGFTGFTPTQLKVIEALMLKGRELNFVFTMDEGTYYRAKVEEYDLFYLSKTMVKKINEIAIKKSCEIGEAIFINPYQDRKAISRVEESIFRLKPMKQEGDEDSQVSVVVCKNPKEEAEFVLSEILKLVKKEGYRYQEIAVVTGDIEEYGEILYHSLRKGGVPCFLDVKKSIMDNPFLEFIRASIMVVEENFSYEAITRYLKSGFSRIWRSRIDRFENYILERGIKGRKRYEKPFVTEELLEKKNEREREEERAVELVREEIMRRFSPLIEGFRKKKKTAGERTLLLYEFIKRHKVEESLFLMSQKFEKEGKVLLAKEYAKCYEIVMGIFEKMVELLGEEIFTTEEYAKILEAGFLEGKAGFIPTALDNVVIGDMKRTRLSGVRALFLVGVNEGKIPKTIAKKGLLTEKEREKISTIVEIAPTAREKAFLELFYIYMMLSMPREKLFLSYSTNAADGKMIRPSYIVEKVTSLFKEKRKRRREEERDFITELRRDEGFSLLLGELRRGEPFSKEVLALARYHEKEGQHKKYTMLMEGYHAKPMGNKLDEDLAKKLYGEIKGSITRLEKFSVCPYSHFMDYGLRLRERGVFAFRSMDYGSVFHEILERFSKKVIGEGKNFASLKEEERVKFLEESIAETAHYGFAILESSSRNRYKLERIKRLSDRTTWAVTKQVQAGEFSPYLFEEPFITEKMKGRIDRIDCARSDFLPDGRRLEKEEGKPYEKVEYARVIDYKSGKKDFDLNEVYYGLDLQLVTYLRQALTILGKKEGHGRNLILPAGAFYYRIEDPTRERGEGEDAFLKELRLSGFTMEEPEPLNLMDRSLRGEGGFSPSVKSNVVRVSTKKDGSLGKDSAVYSKEKIEDLIEYSSSVVKEIRERIKSGEIRPNPYQMGEKEGCNYCKYDGICRFKTRIEGYAFRKLEKLEEDEVFCRMREKNGKKVDKGTE